MYETALSQDNDDWHVCIFSDRGSIIPESAHPTNGGPVVFSNLAGNDATCTAGFAGTIVIFEVPAGPDYHVNSVQLRLDAGGTVNPRIYADNAGALGPEVIDLGSQTTTVPGTVTFTPTGATTLTNGGRYWLVLPYASVLWCSSNPAVTPTGVFTFISNGIGTVTYTPSALRLKLSIDADPIIPPPTGGGSVAACTNSDGRLNSICEEPWQTAAIYCRADGSIDVYGITDSVGWLAFRTTPSEIDAVGIPSQNSLLERSDDGKIRLYRLSTGQFQVNSPIWDNLRGNLPDGYIFQFNGCQ